MEKDDVPQGTPGTPAAPDLESRILELTGSLDKFSTELESIKENINKRKGENVTLKILVYTGLIVLLIGFLYTSSTLQKAQLQSLESNILTLQNQMDRDLIAVQSALYEEIKQVESQIRQSSQVDLAGVLSRVNTAVSSLEPENENVSTLIDKIKAESEALNRAYQESTPTPVAKDSSAMD
jgi:hypothetical protein